MRRISIVVDPRYVWRMTNKPAVALIGAGALGGALLKGWLKAGTIDAVRSAVFDPGINDEMKKLSAGARMPVNPRIGEAYDAVVVALKPQAAAEALPLYAALAGDAVVISVMAGQSVARISAALGDATRVARAMPNLPAAIGKGVSGVYAPDAADENGRHLIETLMGAAGDVVWVDSENAIDAVTAVSGSGPAYYFLLTEALAEAGEALGLEKAAAEKLARATLVGAGALMEVEPRSPKQMREAVTSPGGTTEAALKLLDGDEQALRKLLRAAVERAAKRAGELTD